MSAHDGYGGFRGLAEPYVAPSITDLGSVAALTQAARALGNADGGMGTTMNMS